MSKHIEITGMAPKTLQIPYRSDTISIIEFLRENWNHAQKCNTCNNEIPNIAFVISRRDLDNLDNYASYWGLHINFVNEEIVPTYHHGRIIETKIAKQYLPNSNLRFSKE